MSAVNAGRRLREGASLGGRPSVKAPFGERRRNRAPIAAMPLPSSLVKTMAPSDSNAASSFRRPTSPSFSPGAIVFLIVVVVVSSSPSAAVTNFQGVVSRNTTLTLANSPYHVTDDILVPRRKKLTIEPGVVLKFDAHAALRVHGVLVAKGLPDARITFTKWGVTRPPPRSERIRLVEGNMTRHGILQMKHHGEWKTVCTSSRNWTQIDTNLVCKELGFVNGTFSLGRLAFNGSRHVRLPKPRCLGNEGSVLDCAGNTEKDAVQYGATVCASRFSHGHDHDIRETVEILCDGFPEEWKPYYWRGIDINSTHHVLRRYNKFLEDEESPSKLEYVDIKYAGAGIKNVLLSTAPGDLITVVMPEPRAALRGARFVPHLINVTVSESAYDGVNFTNVDNLIDIVDSVFSDNRGSGLVLSTIGGHVTLTNCLVENNEGRGVDLTINSTFSPDPHRFRDFCESSITGLRQQEFPLYLEARSAELSSSASNCYKFFETIPGNYLTIEFLTILTSISNDQVLGHIEIWEGKEAVGPPLRRVPLKNDTFFQSIVTYRFMFVKFTWDKRIKDPRDFVAYLRFGSEVGPYPDLTVQDSRILNNGKVGLYVHNLQSLVNVTHTDLMYNGYGGIRVRDGAGHVNVTWCRVSYNRFDGIRVNAAGGIKHVNNSEIVGNWGDGFYAIFEGILRPDWDYNAVYPRWRYRYQRQNWNQETQIAKTLFYANEGHAVEIGRYCGESRVLINETRVLNSSLDSFVIWSCNETTGRNMHINISFNEFEDNEMHALHISPILFVEGDVMKNTFRRHKRGVLLMDNSEFNFKENRGFPVDVLLRNNTFEENEGSYVVKFSLNAHSKEQKLTFKWNKLKGNRILQRFGLKSRCAREAVAVIGSDNILFNRNSLDNPESAFEMSTHMRDPDGVIDARRNYWGTKPEINPEEIGANGRTIENFRKEIERRIFDSADAFSLAKIQYNSFLIQEGTLIDKDSDTESTGNFEPWFEGAGDGGEIGGRLTKDITFGAGVKRVVRDINILEDHTIRLEGVTLEFDEGVGMIVQGTLKTQSDKPTFLRPSPDVNRAPRNSSAIRLVSGDSETEGRLEVLANGEWGTVCNRGWSEEDSVVVCGQLGLMKDPDQSGLHRAIPGQFASTIPIHMSNVMCTSHDDDVRRCIHEPEKDHSCNHTLDVHVRCMPNSWASVRFTVNAKKSEIRSVGVSGGGVLEYSSHETMPSLQIDINRHVIEKLEVIDSAGPGLGIMYGYPYNNNNEPHLIKGANFRNNGASGLLTRSSFLRVDDAEFTGNRRSGLEYNPHFTEDQIHDIVHRAGKRYSFEIELDKPEMQRVKIPDGETYYIFTHPFVPAANATETVSRCRIAVKDSYLHTLGLQIFDFNTDLRDEEVKIYMGEMDYPGVVVHKLHEGYIYFPEVTRSSRIIVEITVKKRSTGRFAIGATAVKKRSDGWIGWDNLRMPRVDPKLVVVNSLFSGSPKGMWVYHYNTPSRYNDTTVRYGNESVILNSSTFTDIQDAALFVRSSQAFDIRNLAVKYQVEILSHAKYFINDCRFERSGGGIDARHEDDRNGDLANVAWHWRVRKNFFRYNRKDGIVLHLPNIKIELANRTHMIEFDSNEFAHNENFQMSIYGYFAFVNVTRNKFENNRCKKGLVSISGFEKFMMVNGNEFLSNSGRFVVKFDMISHSEFVRLLREEEIRALLEAAKQAFPDVDIESKPFFFHIIQVYKRKAEFMFNELIGNKGPNGKAGRSFKASAFQTDSFGVIVSGVQNVSVSQNAFENPELTHEFMAALTAATASSFVDATENFWNTESQTEIRHKIFDFDDWNQFCVANFFPFLVKRGGKYVRTTQEVEPPVINTDASLGGRVTKSIRLRRRDEPYLVASDLTIMPGATLTIEPGVHLQFRPNIGILVLGTLNAQGTKSLPIKMSPVVNPNARLFLGNVESDFVRLVKGKTPSEGFLEIYNRTFDEWNRVCDQTFSYRSARVICGELGHDVFHAEVWQTNIEFYYPRTGRQPPPWWRSFLCTGDEDKLEECPSRRDNDLDECVRYDEYVYITCGEKNIPKDMEYWGNVRFASHSFDFRDMVINRNKLVNVEIYGAGMLHDEHSASIEMVYQGVDVKNITLSNCAHDGVGIIAPLSNVLVSNTTIKNTFGYAVRSLVLSGQTSELESTFRVFNESTIPYQLFGMVDICDPIKEINITERVIVFYKYRYIYRHCIKTFRASRINGNLGIRFLMFKLFNDSTYTDNLQIYNGDNFTDMMIELRNGSRDRGELDNVFMSKGEFVSLRVNATPAQMAYGFIAEVFNLPPANTFSKPKMINLTRLTIERNDHGGIQHVSIGETSPDIVIQRSRIVDNGVEMFNKTPHPIIDLHVQNTRLALIGNNYMTHNKGGIHISAQSHSESTHFHGYIMNNAFIYNKDDSVVRLDGWERNGFTKAEISNNYITHNYSPRFSIIDVEEANVNISSNLFLENEGPYILSIFGYEKVRLPQPQLIMANHFYENRARMLPWSTTILAGTTEQRYTRNYFYNKQNIFEIMAGNKTDQQ